MAFFNSAVGVLQTLVVALGAGEGYEEPVSADDTADAAPYEDEILGDDDEEPEES